MRVWFSDNRQRLGWGSHTWGPAPQPSYPMMDTVVWSDRDQSVPLWGWATRSSGILECGPLALRFAAEFLPEGREQERLELHRGEIVCLHPDRSASVIGFADTFSEYKEWVAVQRSKLLRPALQVAMDYRELHGLIPPPPTGWRYREWMGRYGYTQANWYTGKSTGGLMEIPTGPTQAGLTEDADAKLGGYYHPTFGWCQGDRRYNTTRGYWWALPEYLHSRVVEEQYHRGPVRVAVDVHRDELENPTVFRFPLSDGTPTATEVTEALDRVMKGYYHGQFFLWVDLLNLRLVTPAGEDVPVPPELRERVVAKVQE